MSPRWRVALSSGAALAVVLAATFVIGNQFGSGSATYESLSDGKVADLAADGLRLTAIDDASHDQDDAGEAVAGALEIRGGSTPDPPPTLALATVSVDDRPDITDRRLWVVSLGARIGAADGQSDQESFVLVDPATYTAVYWR